MKTKLMGATNPAHREMDARAWEKEIARLAARHTRTRRAYLHIKDFFGSKKTGEKRYDEFKKWFADKNTNMKTDTSTTK